MILEVFIILLILNILLSGATFAFLVAKRNEKDTFVQLVTTAMGYLKAQSLEDHTMAEARKKVLENNLSQVLKQDIEDEAARAEVPEKKPVIVHDVNGNLIEYTPSEWELV